MKKPGKIIIWGAVLLMGQLYVGGMGNAAVAEEYLSQYEQTGMEGQDEQMNEEMPQQEGEGEGWYDPYQEGSEEYMQPEGDVPYQEEYPGEDDQYREGDQYQDYENGQMNETETWQGEEGPYNDEERLLDEQEQEQQYEGEIMQEEIPGQ